MDRFFLLLAATILVIGLVGADVLAGGDKVQNEHGAGTAPGPGDDAQGNQSGGE